jgi:hypothetical protein
MTGRAKPQSSIVRRRSRKWSSTSRTWPASRQLSSCRTPDALTATRAPRPSRQIARKSAGRSGQTHITCTQSCVALHTSLSGRCHDQVNAVRRCSAAQATRTTGVLKRLGFFRARRRRGSARRVVYGASEAAVRGARLHYRLWHVGFRLGWTDVAFLPRPRNPQLFHLVDKSRPLQA